MNIEQLTVNPEAYDIPTQGNPLTRWRMTREALHYHLEMAGKNIDCIKAPKGEFRRITEGFPDGLMRFEVHFREKA